MAHGTGLCTVSACRMYASWHSLHAGVPCCDAVKPRHSNPGNAPLARLTSGPAASAELPAAGQLTRPCWSRSMCRPSHCPTTCSIAHAELPAAGELTEAVQQVVERRKAALGAARREAHETSKAAASRRSVICMCT